MTRPWRLLPDGPRTPDDAQEIVDLGDGPTILFIHGDLFEVWFLTIAVDPALDGFRRVLARRVEVLAGVGKPASIAEHAEAFATTLDALGLVDAHVVGHSFGALVALQLAAAQHRHRVRSLVLLGPAPAVVLSDPEEGEAGKEVLGPVMGAAASGNLEAAYDGTAWVRVRGRPVVPVRVGCRSRWRRDRCRGDGSVWRSGSGTS